jgi:hypothetical protein
MTQISNYGYLMKEIAEHLAIHYATVKTHKIRARKAKCMIARPDPIPSGLFGST